MPHFFVPPENIRGGRFILPKDEARHLATVLRKKPGDEVKLFDGKDGVYVGRIDSASPDRVEGRIVSEQKGADVPYLLRLFQGLPKGDKFELVLEKMTELGAAEIVPVYTERAEVKIPPDRLKTRTARWEKIVLAAAKQSGRTRVPKVRAPLAFAEALSLCRPDELSLIPWESEEKASLKSVFSGSSALWKGDRRGGDSVPVVNLFIGPEGGFSPGEIEQARKAGAATVTLGPSILRTETAGLFVASILLHEWGTK